MKKTKIILIFLSIILLLNCSGNTVHDEYPNSIIDGKKEGKWLEKTHYDTGCNLEETGRYKDNLRVGKWNEKYSFNLIRIYSNGDYNSGLKNGKWVTTYRLRFNMSAKDTSEEDLALAKKYLNFEIEKWMFDKCQVEKYYKNGKLNGKSICYYQIYDKIAYDCFYKDGKLNGKWISYYEDGQIKAEKNYNDDKLEGKVTEYDKDGKVLSVKHYKDGTEVKSKKVK